MTPMQAVALASAAAVAGAINSVAGGGSLISFPLMVTLGVPSLIANATNSVAMTPGSIAAAYGYRRELDRDREALVLLAGPAMAGGVVGSLLLLYTPAKIFDSIVPLLVLFATGLLFTQNLRRAPAPGATAVARPSWTSPGERRLAMLLQFLVAVYGGYFGAGMGIMMLALLDRLGGVDIHGMNGIKSVLGAAINGLASLIFIVKGVVDYRVAAIMMTGAILGGVLGAAGARRVKPSIVRWGVVAIGVLLTALLGYRRWFAG